MKKLFLLYFAIIGVHVFSQDTWNWDGDNPIGNFSYVNNWYGNTTPSSWDSNDKLYFSYINNTSQTSIYFDLGGWRSIERIIYDSTLPKSIDFNGDGNGFDIYYKIENNSNYSQTMTIPMSIKGTGLELNPINGNLTITNTIYNNYNRDYSVYGDNGKKLILTGSLRGNHITRLYLKGQSIVEIKYNDSNSFMGGVYVEKGELWLAANAAINGGSVVLGNADANACKVYISDNSIPTNLTNAILVVYNSSNATIGSLNNSNTHEYSGFIDISNNNVKLDAVGNGNLLFSNFIFGSGSISKIGVGKVILANNNTYTGTTTISDGTLQIGNGGTTGAVEGDIVNNTTLIFNRSDDYTYAGAISGTGILTKQGAGKLTLSGTNTYSGNTSVEAGTLEITGGIDCNQMTVASGATLIINGNTVKMSSLVNNGIVLVKSGHTLEVTNGITNNSGAIITVEDDGSLRQTHTGNDANTGMGTYKIYRTTRTYKEYDYNYWSSPVVGETLEDALVSNSMYATSDVPTPVAGGSYSSRIYELVPSNYNDANDNVWDDNLDEWQPVTPSTLMPRGKGYIAHGAGADFPFNTSYYSGSYTQYVYFEGTNVNNGEFTFTLTHDSDTSTNESENLIGNPYPSVLNANDFYSTNSSKILSSAYFWTHDTSIGSVSGSPWPYSFNNSDYATLNLESGITSAANNVPVINIASGQGFIVKLKNSASDGIITFNNDMRESGNNDHFLRTYDDSNGVFWLNLTDNTGLYRQVAVGFHNGAQDNYETYDSPRMPLVDEPNFYTLANGSEEKLAIQGLATFNDEKQIPLGITTTYENTYAISLDHTQGIFSQTQKIYLEDTYQDIIHNLSDSPYTFTQTAGTNINDRFILRFTNTQLGHEEAVLEDLKLYPNPTNGLLNIAYSGSEPLQITLYNQVGHTVGTYESVQVLDLSQLAQGMYFAKIANSQGSVTRKIVVE